MLKEMTCQDFGIEAIFQTDFELYRGGIATLAFQVKNEEKLYNLRETWNNLNI